MTPVGQFTIATDDPALPGHFPGDPVVPGVLLLDEVSAAVLARHPGAHLAGVREAKFLRPVRPGDAVDLLCDGAPPAIAFACRVGAETALRGVLLLAPAA